MRHNRTGTQTAPAKAASMLAPPCDDRCAFATDNRGELADTPLRKTYCSDAGRLGSVPLAARRNGASSSRGRRPHLLMDKLGERLAFERTGVRLYDALLIKCKAAGSALQHSEISMLRYFRDQEAQHFELLASALEELGGDSTAQTPGGDLVGVEGAGLVQAMNDPRASLAQSLHVMFDAELIDNASWELLIHLTRSAGHAAIAERFEAALRQEAAHLRTLKDLVTRLTLSDA
ncbi:MULTISPECIES: ferritin-like domain-containing protein [unclassified Roseateles]|uniref:ferritin-like domain-containing protein n=1 Tax=unclassified Roseateles TaxID=2626991 RepID=UPI0006F67F70|nr:MULTISPECIES: ferritin-like domain-containing protein [unclassified Roseateles]KQW50793.1 hypothetical protein ASC81_24160 [Pelomonas sp. Root405]KRA70848.1 hypothetical protein ASD88_13455 [Pelomonas sp. Root662]